MNFGICCKRWESFLIDNTYSYVHCAECYCKVNRWCDTHCTFLRVWGLAYRVCKSLLKVSILALPPPPPLSPTPNPAFHILAPPPPPHAGSRSFSPFKSFSCYSFHRLFFIPSLSSIPFPPPFPPPPPIPPFRQILHSCENLKGKKTLVSSSNFITSGTSSRKKVAEGCGGLGGYPPPPPILPSELLSLKCLVSTSPLVSWYCIFFS